MLPQVAAGFTRGISQQESAGGARLLVAVAFCHGAERFPADLLIGLILGDRIGAGLWLGRAIGGKTRLPRRQYLLDNIPGSRWPGLVQLVNFLWA